LPNAAPGLNTEMPTFETFTRVRESGQHIRLIDWDLVIQPRTSGTDVQPERAAVVDVLAEVGRLEPSDSGPVGARVEQPVLALERLWSRLENWDVNHVKHLRVLAVFVLTLALGHLFVLAVADWPYPSSHIVVNEFAARNASAGELP